MSATEAADLARPLILDLLPQEGGSTITDVTYWGTGDPERFESATLDDDGVWSTMQHNGRRDLTCSYITEFTVYQGDDTTTWTEGSHQNEWSCTIERKATT